MPGLTERIQVCVSKREKTALTRRADEVGLSVGAFMRRAAAEYHPDQDISAVDLLLEQLDEASARAEQAVDRVLVEVAASNRRMETLTEFNHAIDT